MGLEGAGGVRWRRCRRRSPSAHGHQALRRGPARREARGLARPSATTRSSRRSPSPGSSSPAPTRHTCMAGALGCFAFGVGLDRHGQRLAHHATCGSPSPRRRASSSTASSARGVRAKDVMLHILSQPFFKTGEGIGKVLEFAGEGVASMPLDERATLTNMAVEAGGFTGIIEADEVVVELPRASSAASSPDDVRAPHRARRSRRELPARPSTSISARSPPWWRPPAIRGTASRSASSARREDRHRLRRLVHRREEGRHGHVRRGPRAAPSPQGKQRRPGRAPLSPVRLAGHPPLRRGEGLHGRLREGGRRARRPLVRRLHQGRPRRRATPPTRSP